MPNAKNVFGEWLKERRDQLNLTQRGLGKQVGVSGEMIRQYENGAKPGADKLSALAEALDSSEKNLTALMRGEVLPSQGDGESTEAPTVKAETDEDVQRERRYALSELSDEELAERDLYRVRRVTVEAGNGAEVVFLDEHGDEEILSGRYIRKKYSIAPSRLAEVVVRGESMNDDPANIAPGSILKVALMEPGSIVQSGSIYVIYGPLGLQLKRLRFEEVQQENQSIERYVWLWSDNEAEGRDRLPIEVWQRDYRPIAQALTVENSL